MWRNHCRACGASEMLEVRGRGVEAGYRRAGYLVLVGLAAVHNLRMAGKDARPTGFLSDDAADHRVRNSVLLGGTHDYVRLPLYAITQARSRTEASQWLVR